MDASTGALIWNYTTGDWLASTSPCVVDGVVYIGGGYGNAVYALNATTGALTWNYTTGDWVHSSPAVVDGVVYIGSIDNNVYALNAATGAKIWNYTTLGLVASSPAVVDGVVYVGSYDNNMYALNATTGGKIWSYPTGGAVSSSPAVARGVVYVGSGDNKTYALSTATGAKIWSYKTGGDVWASPAVADGRVCVGSRDGKVYAFGPPRCVYPVTWKWLDKDKNPVWLTTYVSISGCCQPVQNFSFNRSLGQISFDITSATSGFCNVTVPKLLMDGAFKVLINDTQVPCMLTWNSSHTFIYFPYSQGAHNVKIMGEIVTRIRYDLFVADVNGDGKVTITDIVIVALRFGWKEDP